ncbi:hypothetical protein KEM54_004735 [Ascosphaera aggregata]|nr:hypothetical protein KEM54_004735 [Ascosphaera aggregata]
MSSPPPSLRQRGPKKTDLAYEHTPQIAGNGGTKSKKAAAAAAAAPAGAVQHSELGHRIWFGVVTLLAFVTRFKGITHPDSVVFDEVHFGKFASYYLERTYFFDVHPPFAKMLFAFMGWLVGYDGHFHFDNIGDSYITNKVPYVALRTLPATLGALTVPIVYLIMWESGYSVPACILSAGLLLFDNAHIGEDRLILLDAILVISMALSILCYVKFHKLRHDPFSRKWWKWLLLTGISLSCVISTKYVGLFTFVTIGVAVVLDLWGLLNINRRRGPLTLCQFGKHFAARAVGLIIVPFLFFLFWFQVHFTVLNRSGPGDDFMSPQFQETLADNAMSAQSVGIQYFDSLTFRHKDTKVYLHSHPEHYPMRYEDGRISSQGQQVTGYPFNDTNNWWQILPSVPLEVGKNESTTHPVKNGDIVQLRHVGTDSYLLTHDVASPYYATNQEFTTVPEELAKGERHNDTLFEIRIDKGKDGQEFRTMSSLFRLIHVPTKVAMWTHSKPLPEWGFKQAEINGNKKTLETSNIWYAEDVPSLAADSPRLAKEPRKVKHLPFWKKYLELQAAMFRHNNALTSSHPYASQPFEWPFLLRGVSFWTNNEAREQIYFVGNPIGWWIASSLLAVFVGIVLADQLSLRRGIDALEELWGAGTRSRLYNSTGFFFICWASHYFPFYLMGRQLFLHHYLPAHVASCLVAGSLVEFMFSIEPALTPAAASAGNATVSTTPYRAITRKSLIAIWCATTVLLGATICSFWYFAPLTYGWPLNVEGVLARKWMSFDLHFAK